MRRQYLFFLAGVFWTIAGLVLCLRGTLWLKALPFEVAFVLVAGSAFIAVVGYYFGFSKIVLRNVDRIQTMPERANLFAFTAIRGYVMIGMMMTVGITLRNSTIPKYYLIVPYFAMGAVLLIGSTRFYREFIRAMSGTTKRDR